MSPELLSGCSFVSTRNQGLFAIFLRNYWNITIQINPEITHPNGKKFLSL